jgi:hypothetical protein
MSCSSCWGAQAANPLLLLLHRAPLLLLLLVVMALLQAALMPWLRRLLLPPHRLQLQLWPMLGTGDGLPCRQVGLGPCTWTVCWVGV